MAIQNKSGEVLNDVSEGSIEEKQNKFKLTITADGIISTDERFTMDNLALGDNYKPLDAYFVKSNGDIVRRNYRKGERRNTNQTLPRIAFQIYEEQFSNLPIEEKELFPICRYRPDEEMIRGIYLNVEAFRLKRNTIEYLTYNYDNGRQFVIYSWNIFSTLIFVQECLKRFGDTDDKFILIYREKSETEKKKNTADETITENLVQDSVEYRNPFSKILIESKNIILRGAPGTGKTFLAKEIATDIISKGYLDDFASLSDEQKKQVEFVQFHPSYDYTDFVEGLRPKVNDDGTMGFELKDGVFKKFITLARKNYEDSQKSIELLNAEMSVQEAFDNFFANFNFGKDTLKTINGSEFVIENIDESFVYISIPANTISNKIALNLEEIRKLLESGKDFEKIKDVTTFLGLKITQQRHSYVFAIYKAIKDYMKTFHKSLSVKPCELKKYIFIIDEINRGEISKIFGELFYTIDPGYRGKTGEISTQYSNLHSNPDEKFYIPENVYIIGTMNDIDRSVDSFDFAMRRRFRFIEVKPEDQLEMLDDLNDEELKNEAINRMTALNNEIVSVDELNSNYQIGASYFLKLKTLKFDDLWTDYLQPLLQEYVQGMYDEKGIMDRFAKAYGYKKPSEGDENEAAQS
jgi:hypothetical protein